MKASFKGLYLKKALGNKITGIFTDRNNRLNVIQHTVTFNQLTHSALKIQPQLALEEAKNQRLDEE